MNILLLYSVNFDFKHKKNEEKTEAVRSLRTQKCLEIFFKRNYKKSTGIIARKLRYR